MKLKKIVGLSLLLSGSIQGYSNIICNHSDKRLDVEIEYLFTGPFLASIPAGVCVNQEAPYTNTPTKYIQVLNTEKENFDKKVNEDLKKSKKNEGKTHISAKGSWGLAAIKGITVKEHNSSVARIGTAMKPLSVTHNFSKLISTNLLIDICQKTYSTAKKPTFAITISSAHKIFKPFVIISNQEIGSEESNDFDLYSCLAEDFDVLEEMRSDKQDTIKIPQQAMKVDSKKQEDSKQVVEFQEFEESLEKELQKYTKRPQSPRQEYRAPQEKQPVKPRPTSPIKPGKETQPQPRQPKPIFLDEEDFEVIEDPSMNLNEGNDDGVVDIDFD